ncbi:MAG: hypothetical protein JSR91_05095 [Proteobacteria bacterium]|nr:hypothetical protein [Pseudomonadota bacterium]
MTVLGRNVRRMNADPVLRARINEACREGMKRWWDGKRLPPMTPRQRWKYRQIREALGREAALRAVLS